jgi:LEA14-like dessication related protein
MKKALLFLLLLIILTVGGFLIWRYVGYVRDPDPNKTFLLPRVGMSVIEITSLTAEKTQMNVSVLVSNTLPFSFSADSFQYSLYINDAEIVKSRYKKSITLEASDSSWIKLPVTVSNRLVDSVITANEKRGNDSAEYRIHASFYTDIVFRKQFEVSVKRYLPLVHIPELKVERVEVDSLNFKRAAIMVHASIRNQNVFDLKFRDYLYELQIEDNELVKGVVNGLTVIKAKETTQLEIPVSISIKEVGKTLIDLVRKGKNVSYDLLLKLVVESEVDMLKGSKAVIKSSGSVKSLLKAVKGKD